LVRLASAAAILVATTALAQDRAKDKDSGKKKAARKEASTSVARDNALNVAGVIVKAEPIRKGATSRSDVVESGKRSASAQQLTINTAAVWRDWVRDQADVNVKANASPRAAAERGANSVATQGEPRSADTEVVIDLGPNTKVDTRFRASTDETTKGSRDPAEARKDRDPTATGKGKDERANRDDTKAGDRGSKVTRFQADDLKPGLFVEIDYRHEDGRNLATTVTVVRPVGGPDTPAETGAEEGKAKAKK